MRGPVALDFAAIQVSTSIGIVVASASECEAQILLVRADQALYAAKQKGRNTYQCTASSCWAREFRHGSRRNQILDCVCPLLFYEMTQQPGNLGAEPVGSMPEQFAAVVKAEMDKWS